MRFGILWWLSRVHPLSYLLVYFIVIVIYPVIYLQLDHGFYAPYVHLEQAAVEDEYRAGQLIQSAWQHALDERLKQGPILVNGMTLLSKDVVVQQFKLSEDGTIRFNASILLHRLGDGLSPTFFQVFLHADNIRLEGATGYEDQYARAVYMGDGGPLDADETRLAIAAFNEVFKPIAPIFGDYPRITMGSADNKTLEALVDGIKRDPKLVSNSYSRMLYFSAIVMTTVGFGDIVPLSPMARLFVGMQAVLGITLFGLFLNAVAHRASKDK